MHILICKNISTEGPGTIEEYLSNERIPYTTVDLSVGEPVPYIAQFATLVMLGGPMSVNDNLPYIRQEEGLVRDFTARGRRILGICLGAQIMAKALGAKVYKGPSPEIGWHDITLNEKGSADPRMSELACNPDTGEAARVFKVFQWHGETFSIPDGSVRLASSELYPNQAFRYGESAYAFQFHIEVSEQMIYDWMAGEHIDLNELKAETGRYCDVYRKRAFAFYENFFRQSTN
ncbi:MAG: type 1 glutamine amidotransferase [Dissulfurispiraceae bacterium]|jgi:GMP synthase (glutamine-hydrolysing)